MTNVPAPTFGPTGFTAPRESEILDGTRADLNAAFGGNLNPAQDTPQGQLAVSLAAIIGFNNDRLLQLFNQFDPSLADGRAQDALGRIYFIDRTPAEATTVTADCGGAVGTSIPIGSLARTADGTVYAATTGGTIPTGGVLTLQFAATVTGPTACPAGSLNSIFRAVPGWDTITNPSAGILGRNVESRAEFEARRAASVAANSIGALGSIRASVLSVPDVLDAFVTENPTAASVTVRGVAIAARSLFVCAAGGSDTAVAKAIWVKKAPGCGYVGSTTVVVADDLSGYALPLPTYDVTFQRAAPLAVLFDISIANGPLVPNDAVAQIRGAVQRAFAGADGGARAGIGGTIYASRFYSAIAALGPWAQIVDIAIGSANAPGAVVTAAIAGTAMTVSATASGTVAIGQTVTGLGVLPGTLVTAVGGGGVFTVSRAQTVTSRTLRLATPSAAVTSANIDQAPAVSDDDIKVTAV